MPALRNERHERFAGFGSRRAPDEGYRSGRIARQLRASGASGQVGFETRFLLPVERSVHEIGQQDFYIRAVHNDPLNLCRIRPSSARPRFNLDLTVPSGTFNT